MTKWLRNIWLSLMVIYLPFHSLYAADTAHAGTEGTDFWFTYMYNTGALENDSDLVLTVIVTARHNTSAWIDYGSQHLPLTINAGQTTVHTISAKNEVYQYQSDQLPATGPHAVHVYTTHSEPLSVYMTNQAGSGNALSFEASYVLPTEALYTEYIVQTYSADAYSSEFAIVAPHNLTNVTITLPPGVATATGKNGTINIPNMAQGQVYFVRSISGTTDLSGTTICSDKPVAVFEGNQGALIPNMVGLKENHVVEQAIPTKTWGRHFAVTKPVNVKSSRLCITSGRIGQVTRVNVTAFGASGVINTTLHTLTDIQTIDINMPPTWEGCYIRADWPIACNQYFTCAGVNTDYDPITGEPINYGAPAKVLMNATEHMTEWVTWATYDNDSMSAGAHYVNVVVPYAAISQVYLDGFKSYQGGSLASQFRAIPGMPSLAYARLNISAGPHTLHNSHGGLCAYAYGMDEGMSYAYAAGFRAAAQRDSMFHTSGGEVRPYSGLIGNQGMYLRQEAEAGQPDTIRICAQTELTVTGVTDSLFPATGAVWQLSDITDGTIVDSTHYGALTNPQAWTHLMDVPDEDGLEAKDRHPYHDYRLQWMVHRSPMVCNQEDIIDTLATIIRVMRQYDDTLTRIMCVDDTLRFFYDSLPDQDNLTLKTNHKENTRFVFTPTTLPFFHEPQRQGGQNDYYYTRRYTTREGCDSIVTLHLYVCDTFRTRIDTALCEGQILEFHTGMFSGKRFDETMAGVWYDTLKTHGCNCDGRYFRGCDSIIELHLEVCQTHRIVTRDTFCVNGAYDHPYIWRRNGVNEPDSITDSIYIAPGGEGRWYTYYDSLKTQTACPHVAGGGCDSVFVLELYVPAFTHLSDTIAYCGQHVARLTDTNGLPMGAELVDNGLIWEGHEGHQVWDMANNRRISADSLWRMTPGTTNTYIDSLLTIDGCDSIYTLVLTRNEAYLDITHETRANNQTFIWRNHIYGPYPEEWADTLLYIYEDDVTETRETGCDSVFLLELRLSQAKIIREWANICVDSAYIWPGHYWSADDPTRVRTLWMRQGNQTVAVGADELHSLEANHQYTYYDSLKTISAQGIEIDSIHILTLKVWPRYDIDLHYDVCGDDTVWVGEYHWAARDYVQTYPTMAQVDTVIYRKETRSGCGCDSITHVHIDIWPAYYQYDSIGLCGNDEVYWPNRVDAMGDSIPIPIRHWGMDTLWAIDHTAHGCDSVYELRVWVARVSQDTTYGRIAINETYPWTIAGADTLLSGVTLGWGTHTVWDSMVNLSGCDSIRVLILDVEPAAELAISTDTVCQDTLSPWYEWVDHNGHSRRFIDISTAYSRRIYDTVPIQPGYDSVYILDMTVLPSYYSYKEDTLSSEGTYYWAGNHTTYGGSTTTDPYDIRITAGDTLIEVHYTTRVEGSSMGCDSTLILRLTQGDVYRYYDTVYTCANEPYTWYRTAADGTDSLIMGHISQAGTYTDTHRTVLGFDSTYYLTLIHHPVYGGDEAMTYRDSICRGTAYDWAGHPRMVADMDNGGQMVDLTTLTPQLSVGWHEFRDSLTTETHGCDSVWTLWLRVDSVYEQTMDLTLCEGDTTLWSGHRFIGNEAGEYTFDTTMHTIHGCDSVWTVHLHVLPSWKTVGASDTTRISICDNEGYVFYGRVWNGHGEWVSPTHEVTRHILTAMDTTVTGCDSMVAHVVTVYPTYVYEEWAGTCDNQPYPWHGHIYSETGVYYDSLTTHTGHLCDSVWILHLNVQSTAHVDEVRTMCNTTNLVWNNRLYVGDSSKIVPTTGYDTIIRLPHVTEWEDSLLFTTQSGCDSMVVLRLKVDTMHYIRLYESVCDNEGSWGYGHDTTIILMDTLQSVVTGCDSIVELTMDIHPAYRYDTTMAICTNDREATWRGHANISYWPSGIYYDSLLTIYGCDSVYALHLEVIPAFRNDMYMDMCKGDTITWQGRKIYYLPENEGASAVLYSASYMTGDFCDSTYYLHVTYWDKYMQVDTDYICGSDTYYWRGQALTEEGVYEDHLTTAQCHCDSAFILYLYHRPVYLYESYDTLCRDETHHEAGDYIVDDSLTTIYGCDSIYRRYVHVNPTYYYYDTLDICANESAGRWHGQDIDPMVMAARMLDHDTAHVYRDAQVTLNGCDSIYQLYVHIRPVTYSERTDTICQGDGIDFHGRWLSHQGVYRDTGTNGYGCNHYETLYLYEIDPRQYTATVSDVCADSMVYTIEVTVGERKPLTYSVVYSDEAHMQHLRDIMHQPFEEVITLSIPAPLSKTEYIRPDYYAATLYLEGVCVNDELIAQAYELLIRYPSWVIEQHWNDAIGILVSELNGGYEFEGYQWYRNNLILPGETGEYLYQPHYLTEGDEYYVALQRVGDDYAVPTCPITAHVGEDDPMMPDHPYLALTPTLLNKVNPSAYILSMYPGEYYIYDAYGTLYGKGHFTPDSHGASDIRLPYAPGLYIVSLRDQSGLSRDVKVMVE